MRKGSIGDRHAADLRRAAPTAPELDDALNWIRSTLTDPAAFAETIERIIRGLEVDDDG